MIPLKDDAPRVGTPYVTYTLILLNTIIFLFELRIGPAGREVLFLRLGVVPAFIQSVVLNNGYLTSQSIRELLDVAPNFGQIRYVTPAAAFLPVLTSMFLHGGWLHLIFNMWALWIFGDNVEDRLGHAWYLVFYLICGVAAALFHTLLNASSVMPTVGASGAIAGVMGAYFLLYPRARVLTLVPLFFVFFVWLPAWVVLGYWFVAQFLSGAATSIAHSGNSASIAFWAHVGGFLTGMLLIKLFPSRARRYYYGW
jgi:membrane associated rhomboid family serine protease